MPVVNATIVAGGFLVCRNLVGNNRSQKEKSACKLRTSHRETQAVGSAAARLLAAESESTFDPPAACAADAAALDAAGEARAVWQMSAR